MGRHRDEFSFHIDSTLSEWYVVERADDWEPPKKRIKVGENNRSLLAIILSRSWPRDLREIGLLVDTEPAIEQQLPDASGMVKIFPARIICRVKVRRENRPSNMRRDYIMVPNSNEGGFILGEVLGDSQRWYVDGHERS
jgi:hypothetical protein